MVAVLGDSILTIATLQGLCADCFVTNVIEPLAYSMTVLKNFKAPSPICKGMRYARRCLL